MSQYCGLLARRLGLDEDRCMLVQLASQLHDVGNALMPDAIRIKGGRLEPAEFEVIKGHAEAGYMMLANSESELIRVAATIAWTHHERWDGTGYPRKLVGAQIPMEGRIAAVADVFDALTTGCSYRPACSVGTAIETIGAQSGHEFDSRVVHAFLESMAKFEDLRETL
jgi:putative two-component system response regulator